MSGVIDALKRLERAGAEEGKTTQKLKAATAELAIYLLDYLPEPEAAGGDEMYITLPRGYVIEPGPNLSTDIWENGGHTLSRGNEIERIRREDALLFAQNIATGWLDELADWLESRTRAADAGAETLRRAAACLTAGTEHSPEVKA